MQFRFLGTGGAFDYAYGNSAAWINFRGKHILLDCGNSVYARLREKDLTEHIDYILITHCHDDHVGSLSTVILHHFFMLKSPRKAVILTPDPEFQAILASLLSFSIPDPEKYVTFLPLSEIEGLSAINTTGKHVWGMPSYGYVFEDEDETVVYSGDIGDSEFIFDHIAPNPDKPVRVFHESSFEPSDGVHTYYRKLIPKRERYDLYLYHVDPRTNPEDNPIPLVANIPDLLV
ncbi:MAG: ribonuclease Z [Bacteroidetes bacterium]|nr:MAG: ribonuclease Z [Bacteroidota bacterium]